MKQSLALYTCACFADDMLSTTWHRLHVIMQQNIKSFFDDFPSTQKGTVSCISVTKSIVLHLIFSSFSLNLERNEQQQEKKVIVNEPLLP